MPDAGSKLKVAVMGDLESVLGFRAIGLEVITPESADEARHEFRRMTDEDYAIIYITEELADRLSDEIERFSTSPSPAIIPIPSKNGAIGIGMAKIKDCVEKAVGADII